MKQRPLRHFARVIRSKNAKPYRLTLDVIFDDGRIFEYVRSTGALNDAAVAAVYGIPTEMITSSYVYEPGLAFKFTLRKTRPQAAPGDGDLNGDQQHAPLLDLPIPWTEGSPVRRARRTGGHSAHQPLG